MAFTTRIGVFNRRARFDPLDWKQYESPEAFAFALCVEGVPTERARAMLREALDANEELRLTQGAVYERRRREIEMEEARRDGAFMAASRLLRQVGHGSEEW
jgi:hypothetical protein